MERHRLEHSDNDPHLTMLRSADFIFTFRANIMNKRQNYFISSGASKVVWTLVPTEGLADIPRTMRQCGQIVFWIRSEEHTSELQSLMRISYAVFYLKKKN